MADEIPVPGADGCLQPKALLVEADQLPVGPGAVALAHGEADHGLQEVGLSLGVFSADHVADGVEAHLLGGVVAEVLQRNAVKSHRLLYRSGCDRSPCRRDGASFPAGGRVRR